MMKGDCNSMAKKTWDQSFSKKEYVYGTKENEFLKEVSYYLPKGARVACFAEGEGRNAVYLAKLDHKVTAYDLSPIGLQKTKELAKKNHVEVETVEIDLTKEEVPTHQYDAVVMIYGHVPKEDQLFLMENMKKALKPQGYIIFEVYSEEQLHYRSGGPQNKEMLYHPKDVLTWFQKEHFLHFFYGEAERIEGIRHTGLGHVIQAVIKVTKR